MLARRITSLIVIFLAVCQWGGVSGKDPIGWSVTGSIPATTTLYTPYTVNYQFVNNGIKLPTPLIVYSRPSTDEFVVNNGCAGQALAARSSCTVSITLIPKVLGRKSVSMSIAYGFNTVNLPTLETNTNENKDPIIWQQTESLPAETTVRASYKAAYVISSNLPYTMDVPLTVSHQASSDEFVLTDGCTGQKLPVGGQCALEVIYAPKLGGVKSININIAYGSFVLQLPPMETNTSSNGAPDISAKVVRELPPFTRMLGSYEVSVQFTNSGSAEATNVVLNKNYPNSFTENSDNCSTVLAAGDTCLVQGVFSSSNPESANVSIEMSYVGGNTSASTSTKVVDPGLGRIISFVNKCNQDVWVGVHGGEADDICVDDTDCPAGSTCRADRDDGAGICYWSNPIPAFPRGEYLLKANSGMNYVKVFDLNPEQEMIWSGDIAGRTACVGGSCETADCHSEGGDHGCPLGVDFERPATIANLSLMRHSGDLYKVDASHGVSLPLSIAPTNVAPATTQPYLCGTPGATSATHPLLGACSWTFVPPAIDYVHVHTIGHQVCAADSDCHNSEVCGLSYDVAQKPVFQKLCGKKIGYWTANEACSKSAEAANPYFQCNKPLSSSLNGYTLAALYSCATPNKHEAALNSCYAHKNNSCCGCVNWDELGMTVPAAPHTEVCLAQNPEWLASVLPGLQWMKQGCPTMAVYPYDDKSSTFKCETSGASDNQADYTITFCPG